MSTFDVTGVEVRASLERALGLANKVAVEDEVLASADGLTFASLYQNWLSRPYPQVLKNGVLTSGTLSLVSGTVTFAAAPESTDIVTATFSFRPFTDDDLADLALEGLYMVEGMLGVSLDEAAAPRYLREAVVTAGYVIALRSLQSQTLEYYKWTIENRSVDKTRVTANYAKTIEGQLKALESQLTWVRPRTMAHGGTVVLNMDKGRPPTQYSRYRGLGWSP